MGHRLLHGQPVAAAVRRRAGHGRGVARARSGDRRRRPDERDPRVRRWPCLVHRLDPGRDRPARPHRTAPTGRISIGIPFNIPPDRPTDVSVTAGGDPPVAPGDRGPDLRDRRSVHASRPSASRRRSWTAADPDAARGRRSATSGPSSGSSRRPPAARRSRFFAILRTASPGRHADSRHDIGSRGAPGWIPRPPPAADGSAPGPAAAAATDTVRTTVVARIAGLVGIVVIVVARASR